ncbi:MAG: hypothetical protein SCK29_05760 [Bacillota bacterium]|nr:hypothetical protein [Bacillota bacterium]MDW7683611.1 hypothetical protein [Bacillota bacterium]
MKKKILHNLLWAVALTLHIALSAQYLAFLRLRASQEFNITGYIVASAIFPISFGILLRLPALVERWKNGAGFNLVQFIVQGLPAFFFAGLFGFAYYILPVLKLGLPLPIGLTSQSQSVIALGGVWFGMVLADSVKGLRRTDE